MANKGRPSKQLVNIGDRIKTLREASGMKQQKNLAEKIGCSVQSLSNYEINKTEPSLLTISKIAKALGVSIDYLVNGENEPVEKMIETKTGLSSGSVRVLKRINNYCSEMELPNPINQLIENKLFQIAIDELNTMQILLINNPTEITDEQTRKLLHKLNVASILNTCKTNNYQGIFIELARLHAEDAKAMMNESVDIIRTEVLNNGTR